MQSNHAVLQGYILVRSFCMSFRLLANILLVYMTSNMMTAGPNGSHQNFNTGCHPSCRLFAVSVNTEDQKRKVSAVAADRATGLKAVSGPPCFSLLRIKAYDPLEAA